MYLCNYCKYIFASVIKTAHAHVHVDDVDVNLMEYDYVNNRFVPIEEELVVAKDTLKNKDYEIQQLNNTVCIIVLFWFSYISSSPLSLSLSTLYYNFLSCFFSSFIFSYHFLFTSFFSHLTDNRIKRESGTILTPSQFSTDSTDTQE